MNNVKIKELHEIKKIENEKDPVFVVIGKKNFYNEKEFIKKLNSIQTH